MNRELNYSKKDIFRIGLICLVFLVLGFIAVDYQFYYYAFLPAVLLCVLFIMLKFHYSVFAIALLTPFSIFFRQELFSVTLPTEPMLILVMLLFLWECSFTKNYYSVRNLRNPISFMVLLNLSWMLVSVVFSSDVVVSVKYLISRLWFVIPCFFFMIPVFKDTKAVKWFVGLYGFSLSVVIIISTVKYAAIGFRHEVADFIMQPFYNDHTAYGAAIGLFLPISIYYLFEKSEGKYSKAVRLLFLFITICLIVGFIFSYARATWLSVVASAGVFLLIKLKIKLKTVLTAGVLIVLALILSWTLVIQKLQSNSQDSSGNISKHISSMSNISTDASNTERINRWACALRMAEERPVTGWGCGTYQFVYGRYQLYSQRTVISTNEGTLGNAHSEYIGPLSEQGVPGCLIVIILFVTITYKGIKNYYLCKDKKTGNLSLFITLSLITYFVHGLMNNFLDTDKLSVPFWGMVAVITSIDVYCGKTVFGKENDTNNKYIN